MGIDATFDEDFKVKKSCGQKSHQYVFDPEDWFWMFTCCCWQTDDVAVKSAVGFCPKEALQTKIKHKTTVEIFCTQSGDWN